MNELKIFTENPQAELWRHIMRFSYPTSIEKYLTDHNSDNHDASLVEFISGSFSQSYEYFTAADQVSIQISPLLIYYGATNLLAGATALIGQKIPEITNHGMCIKYESDSSFLADHLVSFSSSKAGGVHIFNNTIGNGIDLCTTGTWKIMEFIGSINEIFHDNLECYGKDNVFSITLEENLSENGIFYQIDNFFDSAQEMIDLLNNCQSFSKSYIQPTIVSDNNIILRKKMNSDDIAIDSHSGGLYLKIGHEKNGRLITLDTLFYMYITLFAIGSICRYKPELWNPFVKRDTTGERLIIEKSMKYIQRILPNLVVDKIYGKKVLFLYERDQLHNRTKSLNEHEIKDLVDRAVRRNLDKRRKFNGI